jgi:hypothetical protein
VLATGARLSNGAGRPGPAAGGTGQPGLLAAGATPSGGVPSAGPGGPPTSAGGGGPRSGAATSATAGAAAAATSGAGLVGAGAQVASALLHAGRGAATGAAPGPDIATKPAGPAAASGARS